MAEKMILWVDDDADDLEVFAEAVRELRVEAQLLYARNGVAALEILKEAAARKALPCLVILDMNMPQMSGRETLAALRANPTFEGLNVIVFTTSESPLDRMTCEKFGAKMYIKPRTFDELKATIREFLDNNGFCA